jgi:hypothetical protein
MSCRAHGSGVSWAGRVDRFGRIRRRQVARNRRAEAHQHPGDGDQLIAHVLAVGHAVEHAVIEQVLRALEAFGQLLADGLFDDARPGETDQRAGSAIWTSPSIA